VNILGHCGLGKGLSTDPGSSDREVRVRPLEAGAVGREKSPSDGLSAVLGRVSCSEIAFVVPVEGLASHSVKNQWRRLQHHEWQARCPKVPGNCGKMAAPRGLQAPDGIFATYGLHPSLQKSNPLIVGRTRGSGRVYLSRSAAKMANKTCSLGPCVTCCEVLKADMMCAGKFDYGVSNSFLGQEAQANLMLLVYICVGVGHR
jgi:hypothetical protein